MTVVLRTQDLTKRFAQLVAVDRLDLSLKKGSITALLGGNGAGKTTFVDMLTRITEPTSGDALVAGHSILDDFQPAAESMGVVTQENSLCDLLTCHEHLVVFAMLRGTPLEEAQQQGNGLLTLLNLADASDRLSCNLSG